MTELNKTQQLALELATDWYRHPNQQVFKLAGYAGTGKTFTARYIADTLTRNVAYCAYTGKAANVMQRRGMPAQTIHSTIYRYYTEIIDGRPVLCHSLRDVLAGNPDLIIIDEASMVGKDILDDLLSFNIPILAIGDPGQLPPVGDAYSDLLQDPDIVLSEIVRQQEDSGITKLATAIRNAMPLDADLFKDCGSDVLRLTKAEFANHFPSILMKSNQIITARNATRNGINAGARKYLHRQDIICEDEKLICRKNDKDTWMCGDLGPTMLVNGLTGYASNIKTEKDRLTGQLHFYGDFRPDYEANNRFTEISLKLNKFEYAYAITCHAAQGSEWDYVVVYDDVWNDREDPLFKQRWRYTAVTRAKSKLLYVI